MSIEKMIPQKTPPIPPNPALVSLLIQELQPLLNINIPPCYSGDQLRIAMFIAGVIKREKPTLYQLIPTLQELVDAYRKRGCGDSDKYERAYLLGKIKWNGTLDLSLLEPIHRFNTRAESLLPPIGQPDAFTIIQRIENNPTFIPLICWGTGCYDDDMIDHWEHE